MRRILLIDKGTSPVHRFSKSLRKKGFQLISEQQVGKIRSCLEEGDVALVIIDSSMASHIMRSTTFKRIAADIPKMLLTDGLSTRNGKGWLKEQLAFPVRQPESVQEVTYWIEKILRHSGTQQQLDACQEDLDRRREESKFLHDAARKLSAVTSAGMLTQPLTSVLNGARTILGASSWSLLLRTDSFDERIKLPLSRTIQKRILKKKTGISGWIIDKKQPVITQDISKDRRFRDDVDGHVNKNIHSLLSVPLIIENEVVGILRMINKKNAALFTEDDASFLMNVSSSVAAVIERIILHARIEKLAVTDELTDLYNFRYLNQVIDIEIERSRRYGVVFTVIFMDLDSFKKVNDRFGHLVGSKVLIEIGHILAENLRKIDIITRYGGDEFVIIMPQTPRDSGFLVAERLREVLEKHVFLKNEDNPIHITGTFGVAAFPENAKTKEELLQIADSAMYRGKSLTKNVVFEAR